MEVFFTVIGIIICVVAIPCVVLINNIIKTCKQENLENWVSKAVASAEQLYGSKTGQQKKEYVIAFLLSKDLVFDLDEVTALIESEVYNLQHRKE